MFSSCPLTRKLVLLTLSLAWSTSGPILGVSAQEPSLSTKWIPGADYVSRAKGIIRALYPGLGPHPRMRIIDGRDWDDAEVMNVFAIELCDISPQQLTAEEPCPCPNPVLKASVGFDYESKDNELFDLHITGPAARARQDRFGDLVRNHREWSEAEVIRALIEAGARYGPDQKDRVIKVLPLQELRPYMGDLKVESERFDVDKPLNWVERPPSNWGVCVWLVAITGTAPSGNKHSYYFIVEPFEGRVISIWKVLHPTSPDFPSLPSGP